jgi:hypothetical protein
MKLRYIAIPTDLGGTAVSGCGTIHKTEIKETLTKLSDDLFMPYDFNDYTLGSTGKREYSGDIDLVVDHHWWDHGVTAFRENLEEAFGKECVARNGDMLHLRYKIEGYNSTLDRAKPRTGYVQIDFNIGDKNWEQFYHYSDGDLSEYKGAHRNLILAAICSAVNNSKSDEKDSWGRPVTQIRWKWGSKGLIQVSRKTIKSSKTGLWLQNQADENIQGPITQPDMIARILLPEDGSAKDLLSLETIMEAVKRNYGMVDQERIWKRTAENFAAWNQGKLFEYPSEISRYFLSNDK